MKKKLQYFIILMLLVAAASFSWQIYFKVYTNEDTVSIHGFPTEIAGWKSRDLAMTEHEYKILETRNVFVREYENPQGEKVYLFIVYSENNRKVSHPPEICYTGSGFSVVKRSRDYLESRLAQKQGEKIRVPVNRIELERGPSSQLMFYFFKSADQFTASYFGQQMMIVKNTVLRKSVSSALIRISADTDEYNFEESERNIRDFADVMIPHLYQFIP